MSRSLMVSIPSCFEALTKGICDEEGNQRYSRTLIYQWLDWVRENRIQQSFLKWQK